MPVPKPKLLKTLQRVFWILIGLALVALGVIGIPLHPVSAWRRAIVVAGGLFFVYTNSMYYLPSNVKRREALSKELDELEKELDELEKDSSKSPEK